MLGAFFRNGDKGADINTSLARIQPEQLREKFTAIPEIALGF